MGDVEQGMSKDRLKLLIELLSGLGADLSLLDVDMDLRPLPATYGELEISFFCTLVSDLGTECRPSERQD